MERTPTTIDVGDEFSSFKELQTKIDKFSEEKFSVLYKRSSRTIKTAVKQKRISDIGETLSEALVYYDVEYACVHGGKKYESRSKGKRACR